MRPRRHCRPAVIRLRISSLNLNGAAASMPKSYVMFQRLLASAIMLYAKILSNIVWFLGVIIEWMLNSNVFISYSSTSIMKKLLPIIRWNIHSLCHSGISWPPNSVRNFQNVQIFSEPVGKKQSNVQFIIFISLGRFSI